MFARFFKQKEKIDPKIVYENPVYVAKKETEKETKTVIIDEEPDWYTDEPNLQ